MTISTKPMTTTRFVVEVEGIDLSKPVDGATVAALRKEINEHSILVFRGQTIDNDQHIAFSRNFGDLDRERVFPRERDPEDRAFASDSGHAVGFGSPHSRRQTLRRRRQSLPEFHRRPSVAKRPGKATFEAASSTCLADDLAGGGPQSHAQSADAARPREVLL